METATKAFLADSCATLLINSSFSIQKLGHREVENSDHGSRAHLRSKTWWLGFMMMVSGVTIHIVALPYADLTLLAANSSLAIIANLLLSIFLLGEKWVWKFDCTAMALIIGGCSSIVLLTNKEQTEYDGQALLDKLTAWPAICFYTFVCAFMGLTCWTQYAFERALRTFETDAELADHKLRVE